MAGRLGLKSWSLLLLLPVLAVFALVSASAQEVTAPDIDGERLLHGDLSTCGVVIVEWIDFECPYCQDAHADIQKLVAGHGKNLCLLVKHFPENPGHPGARYLAGVYEALRLQSTRAALEFHNYALSEMDDEVDALRTEIFHSQLDANKFEAHREATVKLVRDWLDIQNSEVDPEMAMENWSADDVHLRIREDVEEAITLGGTGTPFFWINGTTVNGRPTLSELNDLINSKLSEENWWILDNSTL